MRRVGRWISTVGQFGGKRGNIYLLNGATHFGANVDGISHGDNMFAAISGNVVIDTLGKSLHQLNAAAVGFAQYQRQPVRNTQTSDGADVRYFDFLNQLFIDLPQASGDGIAVGVTTGFILTLPRS